MEKCVIRRTVILSDVKGYGGVIEDCVIGPAISFEKDLSRTMVSPKGSIPF
jgi:hypothetical protein